MIHAGDIFESNAGGQRVVVYRADLDSEFPAICYESLPFDGTSGAFCGPGAKPRFLLEYPTWISRMRFEGAHQLYRKERERCGHLERRLADLEEFALERAQSALSRGEITVNKARAAFGLRRLRSRRAA